MENQFGIVREFADAAGVGEIVLETSIGQFRGEYPNISPAEGVDMDALTAMDDDPLFVTLPIVPRVGKVSTNGLLYDDELVKRLAEQINTKRPGGIFGHLKDEDRASGFPVPQGMWIGAHRNGDTLWAKAYIPPGAARDYMRRLKAVGGSIATSIYGRGSFQQVSKGVRRLVDFNLESLDFAPPDRAALGYAANPILTAEMNGVQQETEMTKEELIAELKVGDIPSDIRQMILNEAEADNATSARVSELEQQVSDRDATIDTLNDAVASYQVAEFNRTIDSKIAELVNWQVQGEEAQAKYDSFVRTLRSRIVSELGDKRDEDEIEAVIAETWEELKPLAETVRDALAGPPAIVNGKVKPKKRTLEDSPEARAAARGGFQF